MDPLGRVTYGDRTLAGFLPSAVAKEGRLLPLAEPQGVAELPDPYASLMASLKTSSTPDLNPPLAAYLAHGYRGGDVTVVVDDHTRPNAHTRLFLPWLLDYLLAQRVQRDRIHLLVAGGTHRAPRGEEWTRVLGPKVAQAWMDRVVVHDCDRGVAEVGAVADGTPVEVDAVALRSEVLIPLTDLDYHYFAGVSGGPKQLVPGIAGRAIITQEHLQMFGPLGFRPGVDMGVLEGNAVYGYKLEALAVLLRVLAARGTLVYALTTVMNPRGRPVHLAAGDVVETHRRAKPVLDSVYVAQVPRTADTVIMSARHLGLNLYQAGKAFNAARRAVRPGGHILVLAPCQDGWGNEAFRDLMALALPYLRTLRDLSPEKLATHGPRLVEEALRVVQTEVMRDFVIGKQKPVDLLLTLLHAGWGHLWLLAEGFPTAEEEKVPMTILRPTGEPEAALARWVARREEEEAPTYLIVDDPTLLLRVQDQLKGARL